MRAPRDAARPARTSRILLLPDGSIERSLDGLDF